MTEQTNTDLHPMLWKHQLINEAEALGHLGDFFRQAEGADIQFLRDMLKNWLDRRYKEPTDLMSVAVSTTLFRQHQEDDAHEHAFMMLLERALQADTETLKGLARQLPARRGFSHRLNSRMRCRVQQNVQAMASMASTALDDQWPEVVPAYSDVAEALEELLAEANAEANDTTETPKTAGRRKVEQQKAKPATGRKASSTHAAAKPSRSPKPAGIRRGSKTV